MPFFHRDRHGMKRGWHKATDVGIVTPTISNVYSYDVTETSARVTWECSPDMTGQTEYGTTTAYGNLSGYESRELPYHIQSITGLTAGTEYHYRVISSVIGGQTVYSDDYTFTTTASPSPSELTYGPANNFDSKDNFRLFGTAENKAGERLFDIRWKASTSSQLTKVMLAFRYGPGYSGTYPNWGNVRLRIMGDDGSGGPDFSNVLATQSIDPATYLNLTGLGTTAQECDYPVTFTSPASLTAGTTYHCIVDNDDPSGGVTNCISINHTFIWQDSKHNASATVRPFDRADPKWDPADLALVRGPNNDFQGGTTYVDPWHSPYCDLVYADGTVDGWAINNNVQWMDYKRINGNYKVRERWTADEAVEFDAIWARVGYWTGSGELTLRVEKSDGTLVAQGTTSGAATTTTYWNRADAWNPHGSWVSVSVTPSTLTVGQEYNLVVSCPAGTEYTAVPIVRRSISTRNYEPQAEQFEEGIGEYTTDGTNWLTAFGSWYPNHLEVFLERV